MIRFLHRLFTLLSTVAVACNALGAAPIRIMVLGDSITQGGFGNASYREPLIRLLQGENVNGANPTNRSYSFQFVGTLSAVAGLPISPINSAFPTSLQLHPNHEGHFGWRTDEILVGDGPDVEGTAGSGNLAAWLATYTPDIALVHVGTNDAIYNVDFPSAQFLSTTWTEITSVLQAIAADNTACAKFLAEPIPLTLDNDPFWIAAGGQVDLLRAHISGQTMPANTNLVQFPAPDWSVLLSDGIHPNAAGGAVMAAAWFTAMKPTLDLLSRPLVTSAGAATGSVGTSFNYATTATNSPTSFSATGLPGGLSISPTTGIISGTPSAAGSFAVTLSATNAYGTGTAPLQLTIHTAIENWRLTHFGSIANSGNGADTNDFDGDGLLNLFEWAFDLSPTVPNASVLTPTIAGGYLTITLAKNPLATDVTFVAESGAEPGSLSTANATVLTNTSTTFTARDNVLVSGASARFIRVRVTR